MSRKPKIIQSFFIQTISSLTDSDPFLFIYSFFLVKEIDQLNIETTAISEMKCLLLQPLTLTNSQFQDQYHQVSIVH